jgi:PKD repeat protein
VANAGPDQQAQTLITLTFNGSGSSDPDGTIASYAWTFGDGSGANGVTVTHSYASAGTYTVTLTVTDNKGALGRDTATATILDRPPVANAGPAQTGAVRTNMTFNGSGSSDPDGTIASYSWDFGDGNTGTGMAPSHAYAATGTYAVTLTVADNSGAQSSASTSATVTAAGGGSTWAHALGGPSGDGAYAVASDAAGNVFVGGTFIGSMTVGSTTLTAAGGSDWFIVKYDPTGTVLWAHRWGGTDYDQLNGLAVDPATGDVIATGSFGTSASLGGQTFVSAGGQDIGVARYSGSTGAHVWSMQLGGPLDDAGNGVAVDGAGNVLLTGYFRGKNIPFGSTLLSDAMSTDGNLFVAKLTGAGAFVWAKNFPGNTGENFGTSVAADAAGNVAVGAFFSNLITVNGANYFASNGQYDGLVIELSGAGAPLWAKRIGRGSPVDGDDRITGVATDSAGNVIVTGQMFGSVDLGAGVVAGYGGLDTFVVKYTQTGTFSWARHIGGTGDDMGYGVAVDSNDNVLVTGSFNGTADFVGATLTSRGFSDGFVAKYDPTGATLWAKQLGGSGADTACAVTAGAGDYPAVVGYFPSVGTFEGSVLVSAGGYDGFVVSVAP